MNRWSAILLLGAVHLVATVALTFAEYGLGLARFNTDTPASITERTIVACAHVLRFPLVRGTLASGLQFLGPTGYSPFIATSLLQALVGLVPRLILDSLLWALVASGLLRGLLKLAHRPIPRPTPPARDD